METHCRGRIVVYLGFAAAVRLRGLKGIHGCLIVARAHGLHPRPNISPSASSKNRCRK